MKTKSITQTHAPTFSPPPKLIPRKKFKSDNRNDYSEPLERVGQMLLHNYRSFDFPTFLALTRAYNVDSVKCREWFDDWSEWLTDNRILARKRGCYDWDTYTVLALPAKD